MEVANRGYEAALMKLNVMTAQEMELEEREGKLHREMEKQRAQYKGSSQGCLLKKINKI